MKVRSKLGKRVERAAASALAGVVGVLALGCGSAADQALVVDGTSDGLSTQVLSAAVRDDPVPSPRNTPGEDDFRSAGPTDFVEGLVPGEPVPVINRFNETGFVEWEDMNAGSDGITLEVAPITNERGELVGYWGRNIGWLAREVVEAPDFSYSGALAAHNEELRALDAARG